MTMIWNEILFFGDSLTFGSRDEYGRCFPVEMIKLFDEKGIQMIPIIEATAGHTSSQLLKMSGEIAHKYRDVPEMVLQFGTNDTKSQLPERIFERCLNDILRVFHGKSIYLLTIPYPTGFGSNAYRNDQLTLLLKYNKIIEKSNTGKIVVVDLNIEGYNFINGIHYSNTDNIAVASLVFDQIIKVREY